MWQYGRYAVWLGVIIQLLGSGAYIRDTLRGQTKPNRVTWFFWSVAPLIGAAAAISDGVKWAVLPVVAVGVLPLIVLLVSFINQHAYWQLGFFDYICGACSALALMLWYVTAQPIVAIGLAIAADVFAAIPTIRKAWTHPETETALEYAATVISAAMGLLAIQTWRLTEFLFPVYLILLNGLILLIIYRKLFGFRQFVD
jgi:hypothetical protein